MAIIKLSHTHLLHNLNQLTLKAGSKDRIAVVLKDNAYGHGIELIAQACADFGITKAVVRDEAEAAAIKGLFDEIIVLQAPAKEDAKCRYVLNCLDDIDRAEEGSRVDLKVDTGMHRNGIDADVLEQAIERIDKKQLRLCGVMTHFRSADEVSSEYYWQKKRFGRVKERLSQLGIKTDFHASNSASLFRTQSFEEDFCRIGIALYGLLEMPSPFGVLPLKPVMSLWADKLASRKVAPGMRVGYGGEGSAFGETTLSTYDIGYGDGLRRGDAKNPLLLASGKPIVGRVSMDCISVADDAESICIFDDARKVAKHFGTIAYEVTTQLSPKIERRFER